MHERALLLQRQIGNSGVSRLMGGPPRSRVLARLRRDDPRALAEATTEMLIDIYSVIKQGASFGDAVFSAEWVNSTRGEQIMRTEIRRRLDQKTERDLRYFLRLVDRHPGLGRAGRKDWLRRAINYRLRARVRERREADAAVEAAETARDVEAVRTATEVTAPLVEAAARLYPATSMMVQVLGEERSRNLQSSASALGLGAYRGFTARFPEEDHPELAERFLLGWGLSAAVPPVFWAGVNVGVWKIFGDMAEMAGSAAELAIAVEIQNRLGVRDLPGIGPWSAQKLQSTGQTLETITAVLQKLTTPEGAAIAHRIGRALGREEANKIRDVLESDWYALPYKLGEYIGPKVFEVVMLFTGVGELTALSATARALRGIAGLSRIAKVRAFVRAVDEVVEEGVEVFRRVAGADAPRGRERPTRERVTQERVTQERVTQERPTTPDEPAEQYGPVLHPEARSELGDFESAVFPRPRPFASANDVRQAALEQLSTRNNGLQVTLSTDMERVRRGLLRRRDVEANRIVLDHFQIVCRAVRDPEQIADTMAAIWSRAQQTRVNVSRALADMLAEPAYVLPARGGPLESPENYRRLLERGPFFDVGGGSGHGVNVHAVQELVVQRALARRGAAITAGDFRRALIRTVGEVEGSRRPMWEEVWEAIFDARGNPINSPEGLSPVLESVLGMR